MNVPAGNRDTLFVFLSNGINTVQLENVTNSTPGNGTWIQSSFALNGLIAPSTTMQLRVFIADKPGTGNIVEGAFDLFRVLEGVQSVAETNVQHPVLAYPNPGAGPFTLQWNTAYIQPDAYEITDISGRIVSTHRVSEYPLQIKGEEFTCDGLYFVRFLREGKVISGCKLIRQGNSH